MNGYEQPPVLPIVLSEWDIEGEGVGQVREVRRISIMDEWRVSAVIFHGGPKRVMEFTLSWWNANTYCRWVPND